MVYASYLVLRPLFQGGVMAKNMNVENAIPMGKNSTSVGTRGESSTARNKSGNHRGYRRTTTPNKSKNNH